MNRRRLTFLTGVAVFALLLFGQIAAIQAPTTEPTVPAPVFREVSSRVEFNTLNQNIPSENMAEEFQYGANETDIALSEGSEVDSQIRISGAPADAVVTRIKYALRVEHTQPSDVWIDLIYNADYSEYLWANDGGADDGGYDNDPEDDDDIELEHWITSGPLIGLPVNGQWDMTVYDFEINGHTGRIDFFRIWVYYETSTATATSTATNTPIPTATSTNTPSPTPVTPEAFSCVNVTEIPQVECEALVALYNSTNGPNWGNKDGWLVTNTPCIWYGVGCDNNRVIGILLSSNQLNGSIPPQLGNLASLQLLFLSGNQLNGSLPPELGNLTNLSDFDLSNNPLDGALPGSLVNLVNLQLFFFDNTNLCEPTDAEFQAWLAGIQYLVNTGDPCEASPTDTPLPTPIPTATGTSVPTATPTTTLDQQTAPTLVSPADGSAVEEGNLVLRWESVPGATEYYVHTNDSKNRSYNSGWITEVLWEASLPPGELYHWYVTARNNSGIVSQKSQTWDMTVEFAPATDVSYTPRCNGIVLNWKDNSDYEDEYGIYRDASMIRIGSVKANQTTFVDDVTVPGSYTYGVGTEAYRNGELYVALSSSIRVDFEPCPLPPIDHNKPYIVVVHGIQIFSQIGYDCSEGIQEYNLNSGSTLGDLPDWFRRQGYRVFMAHYSTSSISTDSFDNNAECLEQQIEQVFNQPNNRKRPIVVIAHSMGGPIVRRCLASVTFCRKRVSHVFTLGSMHEGLQFIDKALAMDPRNRIPDIVRILTNIYGIEDVVCRVHSGLCEMSAENMRVLNEDDVNFNHLGIKYTFIGGQASPLILDNLDVGKYEGSHDGVVGRSSAIGWRYPNTGPLPNDWMRISPPHQYWTNEVHNSFFTGNPYYSMLADGVPSVSMQCIAHGLGHPSYLDKLPTGCIPPSQSPGIIRAKSEDEVRLQSTNSIMGVLEPGGATTRTLVIDADGTANFMLLFVNGDRAEFTLTTPNGEVIDPIYARLQEDVDYTTGPAGSMMPAFATYSVENAAIGNWQLNITGDPTLKTGFVAYAMMESPRTLIIERDKDYYRVGDAASFTVQLSGANGGISGAVVTATIERPDNEVDIVNFIDQGNGRYKASYNIPKVGGFVHMTITAQGSDGGTSFVRQAKYIWNIVPDVARITGVSSDYVNDTNANSLHDELVVPIYLQVDESGEYIVSGALIKDGILIDAQQTIAEIANPSSNDEAVSLRFDGRTIYSNGINGPYTVESVRVTKEGLGSFPIVNIDLLQTTQSYLYEQFEHDVRNRIYLPSVWQ